MVRFIAIYTLVLIVLYSAIPYKTPWCMLSFLNGLILLAGVGAVALAERTCFAPLRVAVYCILLAGCAQLQVQAFRASYRAVTDDTNPYVYSQPVSDVVNMGQRARDIAYYSGRGQNMLVKVVWVDDYHWPLAWYLREFTNIRNLEGFYHDTGDPNAPLVLASPEFEDALTAKLGKTHIMTRIFQVRPGVFAEMWVQNEVWEAYLKNRPRPPEDS